jgi:hypothetical protein
VETGSHNRQCPQQTADWVLPWSALFSSLSDSPHPVSNSAAFLPPPFYLSSVLVVLLLLSQQTYRSQCRFHRTSFLQDNLWGDLIWISSRLFACQAFLCQRANLHCDFLISFIIEAARPSSFVSLHSIRSIRCSLFFCSLVRSAFLFFCKCQTVCCIGNRTYQVLGNPQSFWRIFLKRTYLEGTGAAIREAVVFEGSWLLFFDDRSVSC